ncbi:uncharacterized protein LOC114520145 isoform X1 [Dendronephthya gigantea]|uniref:uncharacterized protein LOC114520145 isoform X1 n=1 Tax=Dendronephthya gigantea TaxID=151771 RepID=UPI001068E5F0|nr:uncharacterized protein LOC114520145 isoform X1 [Dendronephthya gigantea]
MFITVKFGDDREELFNPHCKVCSLLDNIKQRCDLLQEDEIDLSDQTGIRKNLSLTPTDYAIKHMEERDVLILVKIERFSGSLDETCVPLLHSLQGNKDFLENLNQKMNTLDPNSQHDIQDRTRVRRGSVNTRKTTAQNTFGVKRNKNRGRSQSLAVGTGSTLFPKNIKR